MKRIVLFLLLCVACSVSAPAWSDDEPTVDSELTKVREFKNRVGTRQGVTDFAVTPMMSDTQMQTVDGSESFDVRFMCEGGSEIVDVRMAPMDSVVGGTGTVRLQVNWDGNLDLDGELALTESRTYENVAGMCSDGLIKDCSPVGSWTSCKFCKWIEENGAIDLQCEYDNPTGDPIPVGPTSLTGCFCFNAACGAPVWGMGEQITSWAAQGVFGLLSPKSPALMASGSKYDETGPGMGTYKILAGKSSDCYGASTGEIQDLVDTGAANRGAPFDVDTDALRETTYGPVGDPDTTDESLRFQSPYSLVEQAARDRGDDAVYYDCEVDKRILMTTRKSIKSVTNVFGYGFDSDGSSKECFTIKMDTAACNAQVEAGESWDRCGECMGYYGNVGSTAGCWNNVSNNPTKVCEDLNKGFFLEITGISHLKNQVPGGVTLHTGSCYGADNDVGCDGQGEIGCEGVVNGEYFICYTDENVDPGEIRRNGYFLPAGETPPADGDALSWVQLLDGSWGKKYDSTKLNGCHELRHVSDDTSSNTCAAYEQNEDCQLIEETAYDANMENPVKTMVSGTASGSVSGTSTGLYPTQTSCKTECGPRECITVCEKWWTKKRRYRCVNDEAFDFDNLKQRVNKIGGSIDYDASTGKWQGQGDLVFDPDAREDFYLPDVQFDPNAAECRPACLVRTAGSDTNIYLNTAMGLMGSGVAQSGSAEQSEVVDTERMWTESIACEESPTQAGVYECPASDATSIFDPESRMWVSSMPANPCSCSDTRSFLETTTLLAGIQMAAKDMICSSGEDQGVCDAEDEGVQPARVVCVGHVTEDGVDEDGDVLYTAGASWDCIPSPWTRGTPLSPQSMLVKADPDDYHCYALAPGYSEDYGVADYGAPGDLDHFENDLGPLAPESPWFDPVAEWAAPLIVANLDDDPEFIPDPGPDCPCAENAVLMDENPGCEDAGGGQYRCVVQDLVYDSRAQCETGCPDGAIWQTDEGYCWWTTQTSVDNVNRRDVLGLDTGSVDPFGSVYFEFSDTGAWGGSHTAPCDLDMSGYGYEVIEEKGTCTMKGGMPYVVPVPQVSAYSSAYNDETRDCNCGTYGVSKEISPPSSQSGMLPLSWWCGIPNTVNVKDVLDDMGLSSMRCRIQGKTWGRYDGSYRGQARIGHAGLWTTGEEVAATSASSRMFYAEKTFTRAEVDSDPEAVFELRSSGGCDIGSNVPSHGVVETVGDSVYCDADGAFAQWTSFDYDTEEEVGETVVVDGAYKDYRTGGFVVDIPEQFLGFGTFQVAFDILVKADRGNLAQPSGTVAVSLMDGSTVVAESVAVFPAQAWAAETFVFAGVPVSAVKSGKLTVAMRTNSLCHVTDEGPCSWSDDISAKVSPGVVGYRILKPNDYVATWECSNGGVFSSEEDCLSGCVSIYTYRCDNGDIVDDPDKCLPANVEIYQPNSTCEEVVNDPYVFSIPSRQGFEAYASWYTYPGYLTDAGGEYIGGNMYTVDLNNVGLPPFKCTASHEIRALFCDRSVTGRISASMGDGSLTTLTPAQHGLGVNENIQVRDATYLWGPSPNMGAGCGGATQSFSFDISKSQFQNSDGILQVNYFISSSKWGNHCYSNIGYGSLKCTGQGTSEVQELHTTYENTARVDTQYPHNSWSQALQVKVALPNLPEGLKTFSAYFSAEVWNTPGYIPHKRYPQSAARMDIIHPVTGERIPGNVNVARNIDEVWTFQGFAGNLDDSWLDADGKLTVEFFVKCNYPDVQAHLEVRGGLDILYYGIGKGYSGWLCPVTGDLYENQDDCSDVCESPLLYRCLDTGAIVDNPALCAQYKCAKNGQVYTDPEQCREECTETFSCNAQTTDVSFRGTIRKGGAVGEWDMYLERLGSALGAKSLALDPFLREDIVLGQCVDRFMSPYVDVTDAATGASFTYSRSDLLSYQLAAERGEQPREEASWTPWSLPKSPPTYRPYNNIPNSPQFPTKVADPVFVDETGALIGRYDIGLSNLVPHVVYYQCPLEADNAPDQSPLFENVIIRDPSRSNNCQANIRFGGPADTIDGTWCFRNQCDATSYVEPDHVYSGCGHDNDGAWCTPGIDCD